LPPGGVLQPPVIGVYGLGYPSWNYL
jgi:hypothetical protein